MTPVVSTLQQQLQEAEDTVNELRKKLHEERQGERLQAIAAARELIKTHGLTASDLGLSGKRPVKAAATGDKRNVVSPKFKDPDTGKTWAGRGKHPLWLTAQLKAGRSKADFLIQS